MALEHHADNRDQIFSSLYPLLKKMAGARMAMEKPGQTIQATALVHEAWLRLSSCPTRLWWNDQKQLTAAISTAIRRILIDRARQRAELKRGGEWSRVPMDDAAFVPVDDDEKMLLVHDLLDGLEVENPLQARVVTMKVFGGLTNDEIASEMKITERTVRRYWTRAKIWLYERAIDQI